MFYSSLKNSKDDTLSALASKSLKEVKYHLRHSKNWLIRLGDGTEFSKQKVQQSLEDIWQYTHDMFSMDEIDNKMYKLNIGINNSHLKDEWDKIIDETLLEAKLVRPKDGYKAEGGKNGMHTEHLGFLLAEMQFLQRAYPNAKW